MKSTESFDALQMRSQIAQWQQSGLDLRSYCIECGLSESRLRYWLRKFGLSADKAAQGFVMVEVDSSNWPETKNSNGASSPVVLIYPNGVRLELPCDYDLHFLQRLIAAQSC